ncbi:TonB-dependent receptor [Algoriphagus kandeliae]|uniref:TonB-dependent receptor n=1 Tax=Algoriphagus kandeliae TaxID=2562278 RepID=A0A4Y9QPQ9_9BACT|nr:TonB-dependent receptor [Algoriphagus kandeliae]TFV93572.1 TonB-dependent receptor [Algoriphagus kandeliae]
MKKLLLTHFLGFFLVLTAFSQTSTVTGVVKDAETGETLPFCNVFINNTTISTTTDLDGAYTLQDLQPGATEIGFSFMGYEAVTKQVTLNPGGTLTLNLSLKPLETELSDVEIKAKRDKAWERDLRKFENLFLGNDLVAARTEIENPWVIDFPPSEERNTFLASSQLPIELVNNYLGYKITFDLTEFFDNPVNYRISGAARFEEMEAGSSDQEQEWEKNRMEVYRKSPQNMFRAMIAGTHEKEGFFLYGDKPGGADSRNMRSDIFANELGKSVIPYKPEQLVAPADKPGEYWIYLKGRIEIHYQKGYSQQNTYRDAPYPVSWLEVNGGRVRVRENGMILNPQDVVFSGDMDRRRVASMLPLDYDAERAIQLQNLEKTAANYQERIYIHTDRPYYQEGEEVFFQAFINYGNPYLKNDLSEVLHVELLSEDRDFIFKKKYKIFEGAAGGSFFIPDSLSGNHFYLRAYTNWNRNYGPDHYFTKPILVIAPGQEVGKVNPSDGVSENVKVRTDKPHYGKREKVNLKINTQELSGKPLSARLSVTVYDLTQVQPVLEGAESVNLLALEKIPESVGLDRFSYAIEKSLNEQFLLKDQKGRGTAGNVTVFVNGFEGIVELEANRNGEFAMEEMEFYGPMRLAIQGVDSKGRPLPEVEYLESLPAPIASFPSVNWPKIIESGEKPILEKPSEEFVELEEVEVEEKAPSSSGAIYGNPDFVVTSEKIMATGSAVDLVNSLAGNVPGMRVTIAGASGKQQIRLRGGATSVFGSMEPVVMVNGAILVSGPDATAADNLRNINPNDIDRVEIVSRTVSMLGDQGRNGVIAVYLKDGMSSQQQMAIPSTISEFVIEGYEVPRNFFEFSYDTISEAPSQDLRKTLYWNGNLVRDASGEVEISFFTNDQAGPMRVEIRGLSLDGKPISGTFTINQANQ